jgi:hypothetical protein
MTRKLDSGWVEELHVEYAGGDKRVSIVLSLRDADVEDFVGASRVEDITLLPDHPAKLVEWGNPASRRLVVAQVGTRCQLIAEGNVTAGLLTVIPEEIDWKALERGCSS